MEDSIKSRLEDIAAGLQKPASSIEEVYNEVIKNKCLNPQLLRRFSELGIPILNELSKIYNTSNSSLYSILYEIDINHIDECIISLTSEGGTFWNMKEIMQNKALCK